MNVSVVYCAPGVEDVSEVQLAHDAKVRDAIELSGIVARQPQLAKALDVGVWGRRCSLDQALRDGDRVEIYRPLTIDPKEGRRLRADLKRKQRSKIR